MSAEKWSEFDRACMARALAVAEQGIGQVSPNPPVGCVLARNGEIIAEGWHDHLGDLHAEQAAIADAENNGVATQNSTAYVTLEPCNHHGLTPPCTEALLWGGISKVIFAAKDPNPTVRGQGESALRDAGIEVESGLLEEEARAQMAAFMCWCETRRPFVTLKAALDANGKADSNSADSFRFTCDESLEFVHQIRRECDAILVGINTVIADDPQLNVRRVPLGEGKQPVRIVLDSSLRISQDSKLCSDGGSTLVLHCRGDEADSSPQNYYLPESSSAKNGIEIEQILDLLGDRGIQRVMVEGGPTVWRQFLHTKSVDEAYIFHAAIDLGEGLRGGITPEILSAAGLQLDSSEPVGSDRLDIWRRV